MGAYEQLKFFSLYILNGIFIGIIFDFFRALRKTFKTADIVTYIEDIIFWIVSGILSITFIFIFNQGQIRSYTIIGIILGIILYILLFSRIIMILLTKILGYTKSTMISIFKPFTYIFKGINKIFKRFYKYI